LLEEVEGCLVIFLVKKVEAFLKGPFTGAEEEVGTAEGCCQEDKTDYCQGSIVAHSVRYWVLLKIDKEPRIGKMAWLLMDSFPVILFPRLDGDRQVVVFWRHRTIITGCVCAVGVIGFIEIQCHPIAVNVGERTVDIPAGAVGIEGAGSNSWVSI